MNDTNKLGEDAVGEVFMKGDEVWLCVGYTDQPTVSMRKLASHEHGHYVISAPIAKDFRHIPLPQIMIDWFWKRHNGSTPEPLPVPGDHE